MLALAARARAWREALILLRMRLLSRLRRLRCSGRCAIWGPFAFGAGGLIELVAWVWLTVYVALPPLVLVAFVLQKDDDGGG